MKDRVTLTIDRELLKVIDNKVDGSSVKNRSHAIELCIRKALKGLVPGVAVILAGGKGSALGVITKNKPKCLVEVNNKTLLQHNIDLCKRHGVGKAIISVGHMADQVREYLKNNPQEDIEIELVYEENPLGTAGPLKVLKNKLTETFVVINGDELKDVNISKMYHSHIDAQAKCTIALTTTINPHLYGVALMDGNHIVRFVEKPKKDDAPSNLVSAGLYIMEPDVIELIPKGYAMVEYEVFPKVAKHDALFGYPFSGMWLPVNSPALLDEAQNVWKGYEN